MTALAVDLSNYTTPLTPALAKALYDAGVRRAIVQYVNEDKHEFEQQIPLLLAAGIEVEGYVYVWFSAGDAFVRQRVQYACTKLAQFATNPLFRKVMWLDCEQSDGDDPPFDYVHAPVAPTIRAAIEIVKANGWHPGIYTAAWWWIPGASNSAEWSDLPLWNANYDLDQDLDPVNFGGWTVPRMEQYAGTSVLAGVGGIDLDSYEPAAVPSDVETAKAHIRAALAALGG